MISKTFAEVFIKKHICDEQFIKMARIMEDDKSKDFITVLVQLQKNCGVDNLKMSAYNLTPNESITLVANARESMGDLFLVNPCEMSDAKYASIFDKSY